VPVAQTIVYEKEGFEPHPLLLYILVNLCLHPLHRDSEHVGLQFPTPTESLEEETDSFQKKRNQKRNRVEPGEPESNCRTDLGEWLGMHVPLAARFESKRQPSVSGLGFNAAIKGSRPSSASRDSPVKATYTFPDGVSAACRARAKK
jgi:hypothetical protein